MSQEEVLNLITDDTIFDQMTRELFQKVDKDNTNSLDKYELKMLLNEFAELLEIKRPSENDIEDILIGFDSDGNLKEITYDEFKILLNRLIKQIVIITS